MSKNLIAIASIAIGAPRSEVWKALVDPVAIKQYMFGADVVTDWFEGSPIVWRGEWEGSPFEDKGKILKIRPGRVLQYSHFSPLSGQADVPEAYHIVTVELSGDGQTTNVLLTQDHNESDEERAHSEENWAMMLASLKAYVEG